MEAERNLIQPEDVIQTEVAMQKAKDMRNAYIRTWRKNKKIAHKQAVFVQGYVAEKHQTLYDEAIKFYEMLSVKYPTRNDLRKTKEFRRWQKEQTGKNPNKTGKKGNPKASTATTKTATTSQAAQDPAEQQIPQAETIQQEVETDPHVHSQAAQDPAEQQIPQAETIQQEVETDPHVLIDPQTITDQRIEEILQDLRNDPDMEAIFNNVEIPAYDENDDVFW